MRQDKKTIILVVLIVSLLLGSFLFLFAQKSLPGKLIIQVTPSDSKIVVNGHSEKNRAINVPLGTSTISISKAGFATQTTSINIIDKNAAYVGVALVSNDASTANWYQDHPEDQQQYESISGKNLELDAAAAVSAQPILKLLPFIAAGQEFRIDYGKSPSGKKNQAIYISANTDKARQDALLWIKNQGFSVSELEIVYQTSSSVGTPTDNSNTSL